MLHNKKKQCKMEAVIIMKEYKSINRLQSNQYIGQQHISVQHHFTEKYPQHWHNYFEIELILSGEAMHTYNGMEYAIQKGDLYLLTPVDFHGMEADAAVDLINISFDETYIPPNMLSWLSNPEACKLCRLTDAEFEHFYMAAKLLRHECECGGTCTMQLLEYLLSYFTRGISKQKGQGLGKEPLQGIKKAISFIELHFREHITLQQLAMLSGYNPSYFSELFCKVTGQTYKERVRELRTNYARMLLSNGFSVSEACFASGFGSLSNFTATFKEKCGMSPNDYKKSMLDSENSAEP